ncbi:MAG: 4'-phosphopantetheinyl transferase family protein [Bilifractor sp.]|jgi:phosphopantetheinyl transferase
MECKIKLMQYSYHDRKKKIRDGTFFLGIADMGYAYSEDEAKTVFSGQEWQNYIRLKRPGRRREIFWSRALAKTMLSAAIRHETSASGPDPSSIRIGKGMMDYPMVEGADIGFQVSIAHGKRYAAVLAFPNEVMFGIDLEEVSDVRRPFLMDGLSEEEIGLARRFRSDEEAGLVLWTAKEALGKFLRVGMTPDWRIYGVSGAEKENGRWEITFRYFPSLTVHTYIRDTYLFSVAGYRDLTFRETGTLPGILPFGR